MTAVISRAAIAVSTAVVLMLATAAPGHAATTIGSTLADAAIDRFCGDTTTGTFSCTGSQATLNPTRTAPGGLTAPVLTLAGSTKQKLGSSVSVDVKCSEGCSVDGSGSVSTSKPKASKALALKRATLTLVANSSGKLKLGLSKKSRGKIKLRK